VPDLRRQARAAQAKGQNYIREFLYDKKLFGAGAAGANGIPYYAIYRFKKDTAEMCPVRTGNLALKIEKSGDPVIDQAKLVSRSAEAALAIEKYLTAAAERRRREGLMKHGKYGDPDIDKVNVFVAATDRSAAHALNVAALEDS